jgi:hypothetical protein
MVFYTPESRDRDLLPHDPFKAFVAPRPNRVGLHGRARRRRCRAGCGSRGDYAAVTELFEMLRP